jgi:predicted phosphodiesterase
MSQPAGKPELAVIRTEQHCVMKLWAISDLHVSHQANRRALKSIKRRAEDWLILAGDVGDTIAQIAEVFDFLRDRFGQLVWVPGNHELWTTSDLGGSPDAARGEARYRELIAVARSFGILTPEDAYPIWPGTERPIIIAPLFTHYDYSFRPEAVLVDNILSWAEADGVVSADESFLSSVPFSNAAGWCAARIAKTLARLTAVPRECGTILVNHYPLEQEHALLPRMPRYAPWCGTTSTAGWHRRFRAVSVVYGHLHIRRSFQQDSVHFHEVSLGYPGQWDQSLTVDSYLREVL